LKPIEEHFNQGVALRGADWVSVEVGQGVTLP
jgi:hypothetical protein